jgi:hypothetical protein
MNDSRRDVLTVGLMVGLDVGLLIQHEITQPKEQRTGGECFGHMDGRPGGYRTRGDSA